MRARPPKHAITGNLAVLTAALASVATTAAAQDTNSAVPAYCPDLQRKAGTVVDYNYNEGIKNSGITWSDETFKEYVKDPRTKIPDTPCEGNFLDTSLPLTGWKNCSLYGRATYTCDSNEFKTGEEATQAQATTIEQIKSCLGETWAEAEERSSPGYRVLHTTVVPVSITLSTDETDHKGHVVRIIVFVRGSQAR